MHWRVGSGDAFNSACGVSEYKPYSRMAFAICLKAAAVPRLRVDKHGDSLCYSYTFSMGGLKGGLRRRYITSSFDRKGIKDIFHSISSPVCFASLLHRSGILFLLLSAIALLSLPSKLALKLTLQRVFDQN